MNLKNPAEWCPVLELKVSIERCYELNGSAAPVFSYVYLDNKTLAVDFERALSTGEIRRTRAVPVGMVDKILSTDLQIEIRMEFEEKKFKVFKISRACVRACRVFIEWV